MLRNFSFHARHGAVGLGASFVSCFTLGLLFTGAAQGQDAAEDLVPCSSDADCAVGQSCEAFDLADFSDFDLTPEEQAILSQPFCLDPNAGGADPDGSIDTELTDQQLRDLGGCQTDADCGGETCQLYTEQDLAAPSLGALGQRLQGWGVCPDSFEDEPFGDPESYLCQIDSDCPSEAICDSGACVYPLQECASTADCSGANECTVASESAEEEGALSLCLPPEVPCNGTMCGPGELCAEVSGPIFPSWQGLPSVCLPEGTIAFLVGDIEGVFVEDTGAGFQEATAEVPGIEGPTRGIGANSLGNAAGRLGSVAQQPNGGLPPLQSPVSTNAAGDPSAPSVSTGSTSSGGGGCSATGRATAASHPFSMLALLLGAFGIAWRRRCG